MRVSDKTELKGAELFAYLKENKEELIRVKKSLPIKSEPFSCGIALPGNILTIKKEGEGIEPDTVEVKAVANTANVLDSHMDVLAPGSWTKSIKENGPQGKDIIAHIHDHIHSIGAKVGIVKSIAGEMVKASLLGFKGESRELEALVFTTLIKKSYNKTVFELYNDQEVKQHSIGLQYVKLDLAINADDEDYEDEKKVWDKNIGQIINPGQAIERGYFWMVNEIKLFENSAVLLGANAATPTLETIKHKKPEESTSQHKEPEQSTQPTKIIYPWG